MNNDNNKDKTYTNNDDTSYDSKIKTTYSALNLLLFYPVVMDINGSFFVFQQ